MIVGRHGMAGALTVGLGGAADSRGMDGGVAARRFRGGAAIGVGMVTGTMGGALKTVAALPIRA